MGCASSDAPIGNSDDYRDISMTGVAYEMKIKMFFVEEERSVGSRCRPKRLKSPAGFNAAFRAPRNQSAIRLLI